MKYNYMYILKSLRTSLLLMVMVLSCSCSNEENSAPHKGATLPIMQGIADNVPYIQSVEKEAAYDLHEGIHITDVTFTYCAHDLLVSEGKSNRNRHIVHILPVC